jgi:PII-like signaling protein
MHAPCDAVLVRIIVGFDKTFAGKPLYDQIVLKARAMDMAGATVTRCVTGFGPVSKEIQVRLALSEDLPIVIDIVDTEEKIAEFVPTIESMIDSGIMTMQKISVVHFGHAAKPA